MNGDSKLTDAMIDRVARRFRAMGEPQRLRILQLLEEGPRTVGEVVAGLKGNQPNISRHLQALYEAGLVRRRRERNSIYYAIAIRWSTSSALVWERVEREAEAELHSCAGMAPRMQRRR